MTREECSWIGLRVVAPIALAAAMACDAPRSPAAPAAPPSARPLFQEIPVLVLDGLNRQVAGATVTVIGGSSNGTFDVTDDFGRAVLKGPFEIVPITLRAEKGDSSITRTVTLEPQFGRPEPYASSQGVALWVISTKPADLEPGSYDVSFVMDGGCATLSSGLRSRTFPATVALMGTSYSVTLHGGDFLDTFLGSVGRFDLLIAGADVGIFHDGDGLGQVAERVAPHALWMMRATGWTAIDTPRPAGVTIPILGVVQYCEVAPGLVIGGNCRSLVGSAPPVRDEQCAFDGRLTLTRR